MFHYFILCACCIYIHVFFHFSLDYTHSRILYVLYSGVILYILSSSLFYYSSATKTTYYHSQLLLSTFLGVSVNPGWVKFPSEKNGFPWSPARRLFDKKGTDFDASWWVSCGFWIPDSARLSCLSCEGWGLALVGNHLRVSYLAMRIWWKHMEKCYLQNYGLGKSGIGMIYTWENMKD